MNTSSPVSESNTPPNPSPAIHPALQPWRQKIVLELIRAIDATPNGVTGDFEGYDPTKDDASGYMIAAIRHTFAIDAYPWDDSVVDILIDTDSTPEERLKQLVDYAMEPDPLPNDPVLLETKRTFEAQYGPGSAAKVGVPLPYHQLMCDEASEHSRMLLDLWREAEAELAGAKKKLERDEEYPKCIQGKSNVQWRLDFALACLRAMEKVPRYTDPKFVGEFGVEADHSEDKVCHAVLEAIGFAPRWDWDDAGWIILTDPDLTPEQKLSELVTRVQTHHLPASEEELKHEAEYRVMFGGTPMSAPYPPA